VEYETIYKGLRIWHKVTGNEKTSATREVLRNYVLILANTDMEGVTQPPPSRSLHLRYLASP
jgi:integrase